MDSVSENSTATACPSQGCAARIDASGLELVRHGSRDFPLGFYVKQGHAPEVPWHWHDHLELELATAGHAQLQIEGAVLDITAGDGFFVNSGCLHALAPDPDYCSATLVFHPELVGGTPGSVFWTRYLDPLIGNPGLTGLRLSTATPREASLLELIGQTVALCREMAPGYEFEVRARLSQAVLVLVRDFEPKSISPESGSRPMQEQRLYFRLKKMLAYLTAHLSEELHLADIASAGEISESECLRSFKQATGQSPIQYLISLRLKKAALELVSSDESIVTIATGCGFADMSYFTRAFKREKGLTPSAYRQAAR